MPGFSIFNKVAIGAGFCASMIGIGQWVTSFNGDEPEANVAMQAETPLPAPVVTHPPGSDEERFADMISRSITCAGLSVDLRALARQDTSAMESTSGQPGTYLEATIHAKLGSVPADFQAIGTGRGPGEEGQAFTSLLASVQQKVSENFSECREG